MRYGAHLFVDGTPEDGFHLYQTTLSGVPMGQPLGTIDVAGNITGNVKAIETLGLTQAQSLNLIGKFIFGEEFYKKFKVSPDTLLFVDESFFVFIWGHENVVGDINKKTLTRVKMREMVIDWDY